MRYFLTGGTGFLGGKAARMLRERGDEVHALVRSPGKAGDLADLGVRIFPGDITEKESMREAMQGVDGVFHIAGWYKVGVEDKAPAWAVNVEGTRNVLELMQELEIPKGVYTSTLAVNSDTGGEIVDESYRFTGTHLSVYDRTKAEAHRVAEEFIDEGLPLVILMPGLIYGPEGTSLSDEALRLYLKGELPLLPRKVAYCWGHVEDTAGIHLTAMDRAPAGSTYIVGGPPHTMVEAYQTAEEITGIPAPPFVPPAALKVSAFLAKLVDPLVSLPPMYSPETLRVQAGVTYLGDNSKARKELGYDPRPLVEGLRETLAYEQAQLYEGSS
jgi:nucleoside-diphosphate-sugar epimerase